MFDSNKLGLLVKYIRERQRIAEARLSGSRPPWTDDPVLARYHFTNVYREMDPGTAWASDTITYNAQPADERLFNLMVYRLIGREETMEELGWLRPRAFNRDRFVSVIHAIQERGDPAYTGSYMVNGYHWMGTRDKAENIARLIEELLGLRDHYKTGAKGPGWEVFWDTLQERDRAGVHKTISGVNGWGGFLAFQVMVDMSYPAGKASPSARHVVPSFGSNDGWVFLGTGARKGLNLVTGRNVPVNEHQDIVRILTAEVNEQLAHGEEDFPWLHGDDGRPLDLTKANMLNNLCEVFKYNRALEGGTRPRMKFDPADRYRAEREERGHGYQFDAFAQAGLEVV